MKKANFLFYVLILALAACLPASPPKAGDEGIGDPYYPKMGNGGYDVQKYILALNIDPVKNELNASATIEARAIDSLSSFDLDFAGLYIDSVSVDGAPAEFERAESELIIHPSEPINMGTPFSVQIGYHGNPGTIPGVASLQQTSEAGWSHSENGAINVMNEPNGAPGWYPVNDHPRDKALYRFEVTVPKPWVVAATGSLVEKDDEGDQSKYIWVMDQPMASYLAGIDVDQYQIRELDGPHGIHIRSYFPPDYPSKLVERFDVLPQMIGFLETVFGPYPFKEYGVVIANHESPLCNPGTAVETQTLSTYCPRESMASEELILHELVHQWFGDSVSLENWRDMWLKEGMATYAVWLWQMRDSDMDGINRMADANMIKNELDAPIAEPPADDLYRTGSYEGGALVFHALRLKLGDDTFFQVIRDYLEQYKDGNAGTADFIAIAEKFSDQDLKDFFKAWLYSTKLPALE